MPEIHILNVGAGDCNILISGKGNITIFDICGGNREVTVDDDLTESEKVELSKIRGNFGMCKKPINPLYFLKEKLRRNTIFRFVLSHPDMDHLDGFNNLMDNFSVLNFWDSGVRRDKPDFTGGHFFEEDWDRYESVLNGAEHIKVVSPKSGSEGKYWNLDDDDGGGDFISVLSPSKDLVQEANSGGDINDASYVIVYRHKGGRILLPGDAFDSTWEHILSNYTDVLENCEFMLAPHHGRDSSRNWRFLDVIRPKFSVLGCASSDHLAYSAWNKRGLEKITQNQAGNISIYPDSEGLSIFVENDKFAAKYNGRLIDRKDTYGNWFLTFISKAK